MAGENRHASYPQLLWTLLADETTPIGGERGPKATRACADYATTALAPRLQRDWTRDICQPTLMNGVFTGKYFSRGEEFLSYWFRAN